MPLLEKKIILGVGGGIAAYKTPTLVRRLREKGATVRVVMTHAASAFVTPLSLQVTSGNPVHTELLDPVAEAGIDHISLARWADAVLIAPATADLMARLAMGLANDLLTTLCLATEAPLCLAPAMNSVMWAAAATVANQEVLRSRGVHFFGPTSGVQACGEVGFGRMEEPEELVSALSSLFVPPLFSGRKVLVTAGPTREAIDPVRFLSNRSSGKMGYAVAAAAAEMGAQVTLVSGPTSLPTPRSVHRVDVLSAAEMYQTVLQHVEAYDFLISCAAIADYRPTSPASQKIKKQKTNFSLALERTEDLLMSVSTLPKRPFMVGFAAETENLEINALEKLNRKGLDMIAANWVGDDAGFEREDNALQIYWKGGSRFLENAPKQELARALLEVIAERFLSSGQLI